ncbi:hypothetical protein [Microbulbifer sp. 2205BS26-8]|uniref:hypothetical protein n=1 Tax=Microbulbifer sp. 2205BS26-8 TaxID=3064386 RepID=UPI00273F2C9C|nr:hypothetical protein [Microbulbifer sp. 2205BS26-8]MDP5210108.1 hypothetical protein [Microbulbifer sp. 2205BS26-8]
MKQKFLGAAQVACLYFICQVGAHADSEIQAISSVCPEDSFIVSYTEVLNNADEFCALLNDGDTVALSDGASLERTGFNCQLSESDSRQLTRALCKVQTFKPYVANIQSVIEGAYVERFDPERNCGGRGVPIRYEEAIANRNQLCDLLDNWDIAFIATSNLGVPGSMDGPLYGCTIREVDTRPLSATLCNPFP